MQIEIQPKRILFIGGNFYPELIGIGKYNGEMVDLLAGQGHHCTVVTSFPYYPQWKVQQPYSENSFWYKKETKVPLFENAMPIEIYRCPQYMPDKPTGKKRMMLDFSFCLTSFFKITQLLFRKKYDYVIVVVPCFQLGLLAILYKRLRGAKFMYHIQDIQIDAARDLGMIKNEFVINTLLKIERYILRNADTVSSISVGMIKRIKEKYKREIVLFPNWVDTSLYYPIAEKATLKQEFNFSPSDKIVLYSGAIGEKQGLESIIHVAKSLEHHTSLKFVICGSGPYSSKLQHLKESLSLKNVFFLALQPIDKLNRFLNMADIHLVLQKANAADLVMPSKLTTILSVGGVSIITASKNSSLHEIVSSNNMGILVEPENKKELVRAIDHTLRSNNEIIKSNARFYAEEFLSIEKVVPRYAQNMA